MRGEVIQEASNLFWCVFCCFCLFSRDGVDSDHGCRINCSCIIEESSDYLLDAIDSVLVERIRVIVRGYELLLLAVGGFCPVVRCMLGAIWRWMLKFVESFGHVIWHRQIDSAFFLVRFEIDAQVEFAGLVFGNFVVFAQRGKYMLRMLFSEVFDSEIVNHQ